MTAALAGKALLFLGCTALGVLRGQGLRQRAACLQAFRRLWRPWPGSWPSPCALWTS